VVLASCQSAASGSRALTAIGPQLAWEGVPAVLAMQDKIGIDTCQTFMARFFSEFAADGILERAAAAARVEIVDPDDAWGPGLFTRLLSGYLWWPDFQSTPFEKWDSVLGQIDRGRCLPILGPGMIEFLLGPQSDIARRWADTYLFPMAPHERYDLPQ